MISPIRYAGTCPHETVPPNAPCMNTAPRYLAGLMAAPVAGPRMMMIAKTTEPIAIGAQPGTARWSMTPKITNTSMNVPIASISEARPNPIVAGLYAVTPPPAATAAVLPRVRKMAAAPATAPTTWAVM